MRMHSYWLPSIIFAALVLSLGIALLAIGARSPYTHSNRNDAPIEGYDRTTQTLVGPPQPIERTSINAAVNADLVTQGAQLFIGLECASCHGLKGRGQAVGPPIVGTDVETLAGKTSKGPGGMPAFAGLSDADLTALAAYLRSVAGDPASDD